jgi:hypothetical protein
MLRSRPARVWVVLLLVYTGISGVRYKDARQEARPYEPGHIAEALAAGHGFSYPAPQQWFFLAHSGDTTEYRPTAWQEPVWPAIIAVAYRVVPDPERARDALIALHALLLVATAPALLLLGRSLFGPRVGTVAGLIAGTVLVLLSDAQAGVFESIKSQYLLGLEVVLACWMLVEARRQPTPARGATLGAFLGLTALTGSATVLMAPLAAAALFKARKTAAVLLCAWAAVILPWSVRNYSTFGELVPIRTGFGLILMSGNPILAQTLEPDKGGCPGFRRPLFIARNAWDAVSRAVIPANARRLDSQPVQCGARDLRDRYFSMNEAERDRYWSTDAWRFIEAEPELATQLALAKIGRFFLLTGSLAGVITLAAFAGLSLSARVSSAVAVFIASVSQAVPYVLSVPYSYRYRYPLDPVLLLFGAYAIAVLATRAGRVSLTRLKPAGSPSA